MGWKAWWFNPGLLFLGHCMDIRIQRGQGIFISSQVEPEARNRTPRVDDLVGSTERVSPAPAPDAITCLGYRGWIPLSEIIHWGSAAENSANSSPVSTFLQFKPD